MIIYYNGNQHRCSRAALAFPVIPVRMNIHPHRNNGVCENSVTFCTIDAVSPI